MNWSSGPYHHDDDLGLPTEVTESYRHVKALPDGRVIGVIRLIYHWSIHVNMDEVGYEEKYCFDTYDRAMVAFNTWDGKDEPPGWHRHVPSGRRRDMNTGREWVEH